jgi:hypothetical protein
MPAHHISLREGAGTLLQLAQMVDKDDRLPLHLAAASRIVSFEVVMETEQMIPLFAKCHDSAF